MKISIITATFNSEKTISDCVRSINLQTHQEIEHIVIDGESSDNTVGLIKAVSKRVVLVKSEPDDGIYDALNKGIKLASGDVIGFLHSDDILADAHVISKVAKAFEDERVSAVYGDLDYVSKHDSSRVIRRWRSCQYSRWRIFFGWMPPHPTLYLRREVYSQIGGFDKDFRISADYLSVLKVFMGQTVVVKYLPFIIVKMRLGGISNRSIRSVAIKTYEDFRALRLSNFSILTAVLIVLLKNVTKVPQLVFRKIVY